MTRQSEFTQGLTDSLAQWRAVAQPLPIWVLEYLSRRRGPRQGIRHLSERRQGLLVGHALQLAAWIATRQQRGATRVVGLSGGQGSGKSTLTALVAAYLEQIYNRRVAILSLDDIYLSRQARERLAEQVHPLLRTRGVPGTHDVELGQALLDALGGPGIVTLPRFDKARDDLCPESEWRQIRAPVDLVLLEGWCVGAPPLAETELRQPINALERDEDAEGRWRQHVNQALAGPYAELFARLDDNIFLQVPDFEAVHRWRAEQEARLRERTGAGLDERALERFVAHYERLTRHMLQVMPKRADLLLELGSDHAIVAVRQPEQAS